MRELTIFGWVDLGSRDGFSGWRGMEAETVWAKWMGMGLGSWDEEMRFY